MRVNQCVKKIDVSEVINNEQNMLLRHTSAQNFKVGQLVVVLLEKFLSDPGPIIVYPSQ